jgi:tRNA pseudouridine55 synthase
MNKLSGLLLVDKPLGVTSHDVIDEVRKLKFIDKAGHIGTLDPTAEGLLGVLINKATKLSQFFVGLDKTYEIELEFGYQTNTLDQSGEIIKKADKVDISKTQIKEALKSFQGKITQQVPKYSAVKKDGKKLYEYARAGEDVELPKRKVNIKQIELVKFSNQEKPTFKLKITCSSGTYTRSLVRDLGQRLEVYATQTHLKRTRIGKFELEDVFDSENISQKKFDQINSKLITMNESLYYSQSLPVKQNAKKFVKNGTPLRLKNLQPEIDKKDFIKGETVKINFDDELYAVGEVTRKLDIIDDPEAEILSYNTVISHQ